MNKTLFFKVKTTGLDVVNDRIVNIHLIYLNDVNIDEINVNILLPDNIRMSERMCELNQITNEELKATGIMFTDFMNKYGCILNDCENIVTFNGERFALRVFYEMCKRYGVNPIIHEKKSIDLMRVYRDNVPHSFWSIYSVLENSCQINCEPVDKTTSFTAANLMGMYDMMLTYKFNIRPVSIVSLDGTLIENENGEVVFNIGKFKGRNIEEILDEDRTYIAWMVSTGMCDDITSRTFVNAFEKKESRR